MSSVAKHEITEMCRNHLGFLGFSFQHIPLHKSKSVEDFRVSEVIRVEMNDSRSAEYSAFGNECTVRERVIFDCCSIQSY
jgi:hypothetical protein